jgi:DNA-binding NarL/FixJ family response regulator
MTITVFLADDHAVVRDGLRFMLDAQSGIEVIGDAENGREAVAKVRDLQPDVVIIDINMPELNGIEAAHQIHAVCASVKIVILSMYATREHVSRALSAGVHGYLLKESAGAELIDAVRCVSTGRRYLSEKISDIMIDDYVHQRIETGATSPLDQLSPREREVLQLVVEGNSSAQIAEILSLSAKTVETYRSRLMHKLGITDIPTLVKFAIQQGLTSLE